MNTPPLPTAPLQGNILVVDDEPGMQRLLANMLRHDGHFVRTAANGRLGLAEAKTATPDLILTDVNMPVMDGYGLCVQLKADPVLREVPVIFVSAQTETLDKVKAFGSGAVDYLTKPFQYEEMRARVTAHLKIRLLQQQLARHNAQLEELVALRTQQLAEANARLNILDAAKNDFLNLISHELRTPVNGILGSLELLLDGAEVNPGQRDLLEVFERSRSRLVDILDGALLLTEIEVESTKVAAAPVGLAALVQGAGAAVADCAKSRLVTVALDQPGSHVAALGEAALLARALRALLQTAIRLTDEQQTVRLAIALRDADLTITIAGVGRTIPPQHLPRFFDIFSISEPITPGGDLGLEPPMAQRILALYGGQVTVENCTPPGVRFTVTLRRAPATV